MGERTVLILPGAGDPPSVWSLVGEAVSRSGIRCEILEYPMKGANAEPQPTSIEEYAAWVLGEMDRRDLSDIVIAGHSMGGLIALEIGARRSPRVAALVVMAPAEPMFVHPSLLGSAEDDPAEAASMIARWSYSRNSRESLSDRIALHASKTTALEPGVLATDLHACNNYTNASAAAAQIDVPTTVILSGDDHMTPRSAAVPILENLSGAETHLLDGAGHAMQHERPQDVAVIIVAAARSASKIDSIGTTQRRRNEIRHVHSTRLEA